MATLSREKFVQRGRVSELDSQQDGRSSSQAASRRSAASISQTQRSYNTREHVPLFN
jgi:hypothetical protein